MGGERLGGSEGERDAEGERLGRVERERAYAVRVPPMKSDGHASRRNEPSAVCCSKSAAK